MQLTFPHFRNTEHNKTRFRPFGFNLVSKSNFLIELIRTGSILLFLSILCTSCDEEQKPVLPSPDPQDFRNHAYPILLRDCGFSTCHADPDRLFHLYGPGHIRLNPDHELYDELTENELQVSYHKTRAMLLYQDVIEDSLLLSKPIQGAGHKGIDAWGRNVYESTNDPNYAILVAWAKGERIP